MPATNEGVAVPVPPLPIGNVPDTPVPNDRFVQADKFPDAGVPRFEAIKLGDCKVTPANAVTVVPNVTGVVPIVTGVAKFVSNSVKGIGPIFDANIL